MRRWPSSVNKRAGTLTLDLSASRTMRDQRLLISTIPSLWYFVLVAGADFVVVVTEKWSAAVTNTYV